MSEQVRLSAAQPREWGPGPMKVSASVERPEPKRVSEGTALHLVRLSAAPPRVWVADLVRVSAAQTRVVWVFDRVTVSAARPRV